MNHFLLGRKTLHEITMIPDSEKVIFGFPATESTRTPVKMQILRFY